MARAWSYRRLSTAGQGDGHGEERQIEAAERYAAENGLVLQPPFRDIGLSAFRGKHRKKGDLAKFLAMVESGVVTAGDHFLVENTDRLSREQPTFALHVFTTIINAGIILVITDRGDVYSLETLRKEPTKLFHYVMEVIRGNAESSRKGEMVSKSWASRKERIRAGEKLGGRAPRWLTWNKEKGDWERRQDRIDVANRILREFDAGFGGLQIARRLNDDGVEAFQNGDGWHHALVVRLAQNRALIGEYQPVKVDENGKRELDGDPIPDRYPCVVDPALFYRVQERIALRSKGGQKGGGNHGVHFSNLFTGIARCGSCGGKMSYVDKRGRNIPFLKCANAHRGHRCDNARRFLYPDLEKTVLRHVIEIDLSREPEPADVELSLMRGRRDDIERRIENLLDQMERATAGRSAQKRLSALEAQLDELDTRIRELDRVAVRTPLEGHRERVEALWAQMAAMTGPDLYALRSRLCVALRAIVDAVSFDEDGDVILHLVSGRTWYCVTDGGMDRTEMRNRGGRDYFAIEEVVA
ncbi:recombinase family protein [Phenylobacterium terrae]|uniref:Recombinase family protein n=1 Tax=Phenylobacterium terrae TaxID=2665495 RepID=A0ABW4N920_9CAUL